MVKLFLNFFILVPDVPSFDIDSDVRDEILLQSTQALISIFVLLFVIVIIMIIASKLGMEDFDYIDYFIMSLAIFIITYLLYLVLVIALNGLLLQGTLTEDNPMQIRLFVFGLSILFLFGPILLALKASFMFMKPRLILAGIYTILIATTLSLLIIKW